MTHVVKEIVGTRDLLALAAANPQRYPGLLESVARGNARARHDVLFAFPERSLRLANGVVRDERGNDCGGHGFLGALDAAWRAERVEHGVDDRLPFHGGWLLYLGYELAAEVEPTLCLPPPRDEMVPTALALRCPAAIIVDHARARTALVRSRFAAKCDIELEDHASFVVFGDAPGGVPTADYGIPATEVLDEALEPTVDDAELEVLRIRAGTPRYGREIDDRVLPAEAGLEQRAVDFEKGCYPGQEPIARQHYRGRVNRGLRVLEIEGAQVPEYDAELELDGKVVGRVTSAAHDASGVVALAYVRVEVPRDVVLRLGNRSARQLDLPSPRP